MVPLHPVLHSPRASRVCFDGIQQYQGEQDLARGILDVKSARLRVSGHRFEMQTLSSLEGKSVNGRGKSGQEKYMHLSP